MSSCSDSPQVAWLTAQACVPNSSPERLRPSWAFPHLDKPLAGNAEAGLDSLLLDVPQASSHRARPVVEIPARPPLLFLLAAPGLRRHPIYTHQLGRPVFLTHCSTNSLEPKLRQWWPRPRRKSKHLSEAQRAFWGLAPAHHTAWSPLLAPAGPWYTTVHNSIKTRHKEREGRTRQKEKSTWHIRTEEKRIYKNSVQSVKGGLKSEQQTKPANHPLVRRAVPSAHFLLAK